jgi:heptosyltransferase-1
VLRILIVQPSSLGDVVHAMPAVQDIAAAHAGARIEWVVEPAYVPLVRRVAHVARAHAAPLARWRQGWWTSRVRGEFKALRAQLQAEPYDAVIDLHGRAESAWVARAARLAPGGRRCGIGNATEGAAWERAARWWVEHPIAVPARVHAIDLARGVVAQALGHAVQGPPRHGLQTMPDAAARDRAPTVVLVHGATHERRLWPDAHWVTLGKRLLGDGWRIALPQGGEAEQTRAELIAAALQFERDPQVEVWPTLRLDTVVDRFATMVGVIGTDSGLSRLAVALDLPHVQIHNAQTAWRTGPQAAHGHRHQIAVQASPHPTPDAVWAACREVLVPPRLAGR